MSGVHQTPKELSILRKGDFILKLYRAKSQWYYLTPQILYKHYNIGYETFKILCRIK